MEYFNSSFVGGSSDTGPVRSANEDAFWVSNADTPVEHGALYLVADGVGGQLHGAVAAQSAVDVMSHEFYEFRRAGASIASALNDSIHLANMAIVEQAKELDGAKMGCTLVAAVQHENQLHIAHVGDARAYLLLGNRLRRLTRDDTWVQKQVEAGIITAEQAERHELRNVVTQVLGNKPEIDVHLASPHELNEGDMFLLSSDGLHGVLSNEQLFQIMKNNQPQAAAEALVRAAIQADTSDNVTAVVVSNGLSAEQLGGQTMVSSRRGRGLRLPLWAAVTLVLAIIVAVLLSIAMLLNSGDVSVDLGGEEADVIETMPAGIPSSPTAQTTATLEAAIPTAAPSPTQAPQMTATSAPVDTPLPAPQSTSPEQEQMGCVIGVGSLFVWLDEQVQTNSCNQFAQSALEPGDQVRILDQNAISVAGPDQGCLITEFIRVQAVEDPLHEGWVTNNRVLPILPGGSCLP